MSQRTVTQPVRGTGTATIFQLRRLVEVEYGSLLDI